MTLQQLVTKIEALNPTGLSYDTSAKAAEDIAYDAFCIAADKLGLTGFQASWIALQLLKRINSIEGPIIYFNGKDLCYPQDNLRNNLNEWIKECQPWVTNYCTERLEKDTNRVHPDVLKHWKKQVSRSFKARILAFIKSKMN